MQSLTRWAESHPQTVTLMNRLFLAGKRCALISGVVAVEYGVRPYTDDTDLFVHPDDFEYVAAVLPDSQITRDKRVEMTDRYGEAICFAADELTASLDNTTLQVMRSLSPVIIGSRMYEMSHTDLVADNLRQRTLLGQQVLLTHVFDTLAIKALFQRDRHKADIGDMRGLARYCRPGDPYVARRATEIGLGHREYHALGMAGLRLQDQLMSSV